MPTPIEITSTPAARSRTTDRPRWTPGRIVVCLVPAGTAIMLVVDGVLGDAAEYYHALRLVEAWWQVFADGGIAPGHHFIIGQEAMGDGLSLAVGSALLVVEPAIALAMVVYPASWATRRLRSLRRRQRAGRRDGRLVAA